jgi:polyisoprenoid-binding protein YceI
MFKKYTILFVLLVMVFGTAFGAVEFTADKAHSSVSFTISHMVVSKVRGNFNDFAITFMYDADNILKSAVTATIKTASIDTRNEKRDNHLRSADFFNVEKFPEITFKSNKFIKKGKDHAVVGTLTINGVSKEVTVPFKIMGSVADPRGGTRLGLEGFTLLDRKDFGIKWNRALDKGGFILGDQVTIEILLEMKSK